MRRFCDCDSEWDMTQPISAKGTQATGKNDYCWICHMYRWYEPHYENEMFDLRSMNEIW